MSAGADERMVNLIKRKLGVSLGPDVADSLAMRRDYDGAAGCYAGRIEAMVLAEHLPPQAVRHRSTIDVSAYATWFDHFCATYRNRWWGWCLGLDLHSIRYSVTQREHVVQVNITNEWLYPKSTLRVADLGEPVLHTFTSSRAWVAEMDRP